MTRCNIQTEGISKAENGSSVVIANSTDDNNSTEVMHEPQQLPPPPPQLQQGSIASEYFADKARHHRRHDETNRKERRRQRRGKQTMSRDDYDDDDDVVMITTTTTTTTSQDAFSEVVGAAAAAALEEYSPQHGSSNNEYEEDDDTDADNTSVFPGAEHVPGIYGVVDGGDSGESNEEDEQHVGGGGGDISGAQQTTSRTASVTESSNQERLISAVLVSTEDHDPPQTIEERVSPPLVLPLVMASPVPAAYWSRKRIGMVVWLCLSTVGVVVLIVVVVVSVNKNSSSYSSSSVPTSSEEDGLTSLSVSDPMISEAPTSTPDMIRSTTSSSIPTSLLPSTSPPTPTPQHWIQIGPTIMEFVSKKGDGNDIGSVSMNGNGTTVVVGVPNDDVAYVYDYYKVGYEIYWELVETIGSTSDEFSNTDFDDTGWFGHSVSISKDGYVVAVGSSFPILIDPVRDENSWDPTIDSITSDRRSKVRVYRRQKKKTNSNSTTPQPVKHIQWGSDIVFNATLGQIALNRDGTVLAIAGGLSHCLVHLFRFSEHSTDWVPLSEEEGVACIENDFLRLLDRPIGYSVSLSGDGTTLAVGAPWATDACGYLGGYTFVRVYQFSYANSRWRTLGQDITLPAFEESAIGASISLSEDGQVLAVGTPGRDGPDGKKRNAGMAQMYRFNSSKNIWEQLGRNLFGDAKLDKFGIGISLSSDRMTVAIGASGSNGNGDDSGRVSLFRYDSSPSIMDWIPYGTSNTVIGPFAGAQAGSSIALSDDGNTLCVGINRETEPVNIQGNYIGLVQVFGIF